MGRVRILSRYQERKSREAKRRFPISPFTIVLLALGFFFWKYFLITTTYAANCELAVYWISGWFGFVSPLQLYGLSFALALVIWCIRLFSFWRELNFFETLLQGVFILGFLVSLGFVKAMILPYATPSYAQATYIAKRIAPQQLRLEEEKENLAPNSNPWPYDFPPPPPYPDRWSWTMGYNPDLREIFTSKNSPTFGEYSQVKECAARYRARIEDRERALAEYKAWVKKYSWRLERD